MSQELGKKIIKYHVTLLIIVVLVSLLATFLFIYSYLFSALDNINDIYNLKDDAGFETINTEAFDEVYDDLKEKTKNKNRLRIYNSPF